MMKTTPKHLLRHLIIFFIVSSALLTSSFATASWWNRFVGKKQASQQSTNVSPQAGGDSRYPSLSTAQVTDIQKLVKTYLIANPHILVEVSKALEAQQQQKLQSTAKTMIQSQADKIFNDPNSPTVGNLQGNVTLVEFFDYQCSHCKAAAQTVTQLLQKNPNLKVIYKEFPIFGETSSLAAQAALAANIKGQYKAFHDALFAVTGPINQQSIDAINKVLNIDPSSLTAAQKAQIQQQLQQTRALAIALGLRGTPAFIVANKDHSQSVLIPGAVPFATLQAAIDKLNATQAQGASGGARPNTIQPCRNTRSSPRSSFRNNTCNRNNACSRSNASSRSNRISVIVQNISFKRRQFLYL